ncbi:MAG: P-type conjugative transfer protein TrbL, partial [Rudaea sp.]|nr:P-type conjugative transfer protein TrbL [Rudaea sp.]
MTPNAGILTQLLQAFLTIFNGGWTSLRPSAMSLFGILVGIELTLCGLWWAMSGNDAIKSLIQKLLVIGLFFFFIQQWQMVTTTTLQSFARAGATAGGGNLTALSDPSAVVAEGLNAIQPLSDKVDALTQGTWTALKNLGTIMQLGLAMIGILFSFFLLGIQCFLVYVEFYIVAILSLILLPFGVFRHTAFLAEKAFGAVLAHGIKLMVLAFVIAIAQPVLQQITLSPDFSMRDAWCTLLAAMAICFLAWHAPGMAAGLLAGSPSLSAGH